MDKPELILPQEEIERIAISQVMRLLGKRKSERKTISCRANAKLPRRRSAAADKRTVSKPLAILMPIDQNEAK